MAKQSGGRMKSFYEIFDDNLVESKKGPSEVLRIAEIEPRKDQPRKDFDREALEVLADSIATYGVLQPIIVRESTVAEGTYEIIAGERRWRAAKMAGLSEIPAVIFDGDELKAAQVALIENIQREDLNPVEEAMAFRALIKEYDLTQEELSEKVGKSRSAIANTMRLLDLPDEILTMVAAGDLSAGHARTLLGVKDRDNMLILADKTIEFDYSVRQLEEEVKRINKPKKEEPAPEEALPVVDYFREMELRVMSHLGRKVKIEEKGRKKSITLFYEDNEDLDELLTTICGKEFLEEI